MNETMMEKLYEEYWENRAMASDDVRRTYVVVFSFLLKKLLTFVARNDIVFMGYKRR